MLEIFSPLPHPYPRCRPKCFRNTSYSQTNFLNIFQDDGPYRRSFLKSFSNFFDHLFITNHAFLNLKNKYLHVVSTRAVHDLCRALHKIIVIGLFRAKTPKKILRSFDFTQNFLRISLNGLVKKITVISI